MALPIREADRVGRLARAGLDHLTFQREVDAVLRAAVGYDVAAWATIDPATLMVTGCTPIGDDPFPPDHALRTVEHDFLATEPLTLRSFVKHGGVAGTLHSEFDDMRDSIRYREVLAPVGVVDELYAIFTVDGRCWGGVRAYRHGDGARPFEQEDTDQFAAVAEAVAEGLRLGFLRAATDEDAGVDDPPGIVMLDAAGRIAACTSQARVWLDTLGDEAHVPIVTASLAARLGTADGASTVVVGSRGPLALHASRLKGDLDEIAIVIERPRPIQLTPRVMDAYDLTRRESEVTELVLRGKTTAQIARVLDVSTYTVQDHLKSIFAKVGVQTRGELANEVYVRFYLPPKTAGVTPGPYGYFLGL
jgi:DNA-binding CsgD family transcriptional regulator